MDAFEPSSLLAPAEQELESLKNRLRTTASPGLALAPLEPLFDDLLEAFDELRPAQVVAPLEDAITGVVEGIVDALPVEETFEAVGAALAEVENVVEIGNTVQELLERLRDTLEAFADPAEQLADWVDSILAKVEGLPDDGALASAVTALGTAVNGARAETLQSLLCSDYPREKLKIYCVDDCSSDDTFEIMSEMALSYEGPHRIVLNRNPKNLGLVPHVNKACLELAHGQLLVMAAGDDVSIPERTERLWRAWQASNEEASLVTSGMVRIDSEGKEVGSWSPPEVGYVRDDIRRFILGPHRNCHGATAMYAREVFDVFGPLDRARVEVAGSGAVGLAYMKTGCGPAAPSCQRAGTGSPAAGAARRSTWTAM